MAGDGLGLPDPTLPREWRIPPWQPAALVLMVCILAAWDIYGDPSATVRVVTIFISLSLLGIAVVAARYLLVADADGIWVRGLFGEQVVHWSEFRDVDVEHRKRGVSTLRINRRDGTSLEVPPSLLQPALPTKIDNARRMLAGVATQLEDIARQQTG